MVNSQKFWGLDCFVKILCWLEGVFSGLFLLVCCVVFCCSFVWNV